MSVHSWKLRGSIWLAHFLCLVVGSVLFESAALARAADPPKALTDVSITPAFFNPSIGQRERIEMVVSQPGTVDVEILDCDRFLIRKLGRQSVQPGRVVLEWDGRDAAGSVVPDEAFFCRIHFLGEGGEQVYDPSLSFGPTVQSLAGCSYSRSDGVLGYTIPWPARVHVQAGQSALDPESRTSTGPVLKTIVDREPRAAGSVIEQWNGLDESGLVFVPDLPHFAVSISLDRLPENAVITVGNRGETFFDYARRVRSPSPQSARRAGSRPGKQAERFSTCGGQTPRLKVEAQAELDADSQRYELGNTPLEIVLTLDPLRARYFLNPGAGLNVFVDEALVLAQPAAESPVRIVLARDRLQPGQHRVAFVWASGNRPVATSAIQVEVMPLQPSRSSGGPGLGEPR